MATHRKWVMVNGKPTQIDYTISPEIYDAANNLLTGVELTR